MTIFEQVKSDLRGSMTSGDRDLTQALRLVMADISKEAIDNGLDRNNIPDEVSLPIVEKTVKKLKESIEIYKNSGRFELAAEDQKQLSYLQEYLPTQMTDEELRLVVEKVKSENPQLQGMAVMGKIMPLVKGKADANRIKALL